MRHRTVVITGASAGLGAALALAYAAPGRVLGLVARRQPALDAVAAECQAAGAEVIPAAIDVRDHTALGAWIAALDQRHPVDLAIANAGVFDGTNPSGAPEGLTAACRLIDTNLTGMIATVLAAAAVMRARRRGNIAIVSSLAALMPQPDAPTYAASKAAAAAYAESMRLGLAADGIAVSLVLPGHVVTGQTRRHIGRLPMLVTADRAASCIVRGIERNVPVIAFPRTLYWLARLGGALPWTLRRPLDRALRFRVEPDTSG